MNAVVVENLRKTFLDGKRVALDAINASFSQGLITGIVGPDGAGKTTLIRSIVGLLKPDGGRCLVFGNDSLKEPEKIHGLIGYLPQKFGLYEDLTVAQNLDLYSDLQGVKEEDPIFKRLLEFSGLEPFLGRLAGNLSGGMKQKLGLACAMLRRPKVVLLDEPTIGVDPYSQQEMWKMIAELKASGMTLLVSTSYLEEAELCDQVLLLNGGKILYAGPPAGLTRRLEGRTFHVSGIGNMKRQVLENLIGRDGVTDATIEGDEVRVVLKEVKGSIHPQDYGLDENTRFKAVAPRFEDAFIDLLGGVPKRPPMKLTPHQMIDGDHPIVEANGLSKRFGEFTAVDNISFSLKKGEIFGLLGPNGAGKSTTFKMLCGLIKPTSGEALVGGKSLRRVATEARTLIGYMAQKFALYDDMSVVQNMRFFSGVYSVPDREKVIDEMIEVFDLEDQRKTLAKDLPLGYKQRLALSCALMHQPRVLFLDEPTSGVDPITRREFWHQINLLTSSGVTVLVTTHLMDEAEFCDRIGFINRGRLVVIDTPTALKKRVVSSQIPRPTLRDAFLHLCGDDKRGSA